MRKFGVQLYSVKNEFAKDVWGTLRAVKSMGYDGVEFFWEYRHSAQELKAALLDTGLECCGWHTPWHYVQDTNLMATITYNKVLGNAEITVPGLPDEMTNSKAAWLDTAKKFNEVAKKLAPYGMKLSYHNHHQEFLPVEGELPVHIFMDNTCPTISLQLDNGNAMHAGPGTDINAIVQKYPGRIRALHHKPYSHSGGGYSTMIGTDDIDWANYIALCEKNNAIDWHIVEYEDAKYTEFDGIKGCLAGLRKLGL
jgi:sugar phosphate isomerase/epimerase